MPEVDPTLLTAITSVAVIISAIAGGAAAIFIALQVTQMKQTRQIDTFLNVFNTGNQEYMRRAANWVKYDMSSQVNYENVRSNSTNWSYISEVIHYFEMVGILANNNHIQSDIVFDQMGPWIAGTWEKLLPIIEAHRRAKGSPSYAENFEVMVQNYYEWTRNHPPRLEKRSRFDQEHARHYYQIAGGQVSGQSSSRPDDSRQETQEG